MSYLQDFRKKIEENDYHNFLKIWEEYCFSEEVDAQELYQILQDTYQSPLAHYFGQNVNRCLSLIEKIDNDAFKDKIIKILFDIQNINTDDLAEYAYQYLHEKYKNDPYFDKKIHLIGLRTRENFQKAISNYELLSHLGVGKFVFHTSGWGTGEVLDLSLIREEVTLEFEFVIGKRSLSFHNAMKTLVPLSDDHFLSKRFGNPDQLEEEAKKNPLGIMHLLLRDLGSKTAAEIRDELCELVIPEDEWLRWWQNTRSKMKKDTQIECPADLHKPFCLLEEAQSHETVLHQALEAKPSVDEMIQLVHTFIRDFSETLKNPEFKQSLQTKLHEIISKEHLSDSQKIQVYFLLESLGDEKAYPALAKIMQTLPSVEDIIQEIPILSFKKRALLLVKKEREDFEKIFFNLFFIIHPNMLRDYLLSELNQLSDKQKLETKLQELLNNPLAYPHAFIWYFQKIIGKKTHLPLNDQKNQNRLFEGFLILFDHLSQEIESHEMAKKMSNLLCANRFKIVREIFEKANTEEMKEFLLLFSKCRLISSEDIRIINSVAQSIHPELESIETKEEIAADDLVLWTTEQGYNRIKKKMDDLTSTQMIESAKEIQEAASLGDLRENAEYKAALEKRNRLQEEIKTLSSQFSNAQVLTKDKVMVDKVGIGSVVDCKNDKDELFRFTILGPWDSNTEKNIISLQSNLAQTMKNLSVGDNFLFQDENYTIVAISNYFDIQSS